MGQLKLLGLVLKAWSLLSRLDVFYALAIVRRLIVVLEDLHDRSPEEKFGKDVADLVMLVLEHHGLRSPRSGTG